MAYEDNLTTIPDDVYFALSGHQVKRILFILNQIKSNNRDRIMSLRFSSPEELYDSIINAEQIKYKDNRKKPDDNKMV